MPVTEQRQWEIADQIAKHLVQEEGLKSPNMLQNPRDKGMLQEAVERLGLQQEVGTDYFGLMGRVNPKLCEYWAKPQ